MLKGIESIKVDRYGGVNNETLYIKVDKWLSKTSEKDKEKGVVWRCYSDDGKELLNETKTGPYYWFIVTISPKFSGCDYFVEARWVGSNPNEAVRLRIRREDVKPKIVASKWSETEGGADIRKSKEFSYGYPIYLTLYTEGLNNQKVIIDVYKRKIGKDPYITSYMAQVSSGEIHLEINNTFEWLRKIGAGNNDGSLDEFYVKVKNLKYEYISDGKDSDHARFLRIRNKNIRTQSTNYNVTASKVGRPDFSYKRYEHCKFDKIVIIENEGEDEEVSTTIFEKEKTKTSNSLVYETVASGESYGEIIKIDVKNFEIKACLSKKHTNEFTIQRKGGNSVTYIDINSNNGYRIYSQISNKYVLPSLKEYIWPISPIISNHFMVDIHSCRYFNDTSMPTFIMKVFPDIKWAFSFFLNLTNDLAIMGSNLTPTQLANFRENAGKIGAEKRWQQKQASIGFSFKGEWNKIGDDSYRNSNEFTVEYEATFKKIYNILSSTVSIIDGITNITGGAARLMKLGGLPITFAITPPNIKIEASWKAQQVKERGIVGVLFNISLIAEPLIAAEFTIDLLAGILVAASSLTTGGAANKAVYDIYNEIKGFIQEGIKKGDENSDVKFELNGDFYIDLVISAEINFALNTEFNTKDIASNKSLWEHKNKLKAEMKAGVLAKGKAVILIVEADAEFGAEIKGSASITFGSIVESESRGISLIPVLIFDGLKGEYILKINVGLSVKKSRAGYEGEKKASKIFWKKFDVYEELGKIWGFEIKIPLTYFPFIR